MRCEGIDNDEITCEISGGELQVVFTPELTADTSTRYAMLHVLSTEKSTTNIIARYYLKINLQQQTPSKSYNHVIPINSTEKLKLSFVNTEQRTVAYTITTNHPELLRFKVEEVSLQAGERHVIYMKFFPYETIGSVDLLLFINRKEDNQTVKCLGINVKYQ